MKKKLSHTLTAISSVGLTIAINAIPLTRPASAETVARAYGRCKLSVPDYTLYDGHCTAKQLRRDGTTTFVMDLDNGSSYSFSGPNKQALQVETPDGIHNVSYKEDPDKGVFAWDEEGARNTLSVKLDAQQPADVSHDSTGKSIGIALAGAAVGALIGSLLSGGKSNAPSTPAQTGQSDQALAFARDKCSSALVKESGQRVGMNDDTLTLYPISNAQNGLRGPATLGDGATIQFDCVVNIRTGAVEKINY